MTFFRLILPEWAKQKNSALRRVVEAIDLSSEEISDYNAQGYNIYYLPNRPSQKPDGVVDGTHIDTFEWVFVDCDLKDGVYESKDQFLEAVGAAGISPTNIVDSGNGVHVYWRLHNLDAMSFLRFQRRLMRVFQTDDAVATLYQLMRYPGTLNTKVQDSFKECEILYRSQTEYTAEQFDRLLPPITLEDEQYCQQHYDKTYGLNQSNATISDVLPPKFGKLLKDNDEAKQLWSEPSDDRSKGDYRLGHLMFANGFSKDEALSVLVNTAKAMERAPIHRHNYAMGIADKIWTYTLNSLSPTVREILSRGEDTLKGTRFPCHKLVDDTEHGFRLGQVIGIIGGSGVGKTTLTLNMFLWFCEHNPDYHHFFFSLEQPVGEIAARIRTICNGNEALYDKIHIVSNYGDDGEYKHLSLSDIEAHILAFQTEYKVKVGSAVVDHIGVLAKETKNGENDGLIGVCRGMKAMAVRCNIMLMMLSQAPREKAGVGDLELDKSAAYGTVFFESFVDYCLCMWQPLKRAYDQGAPTLMALKFAKIRHKRQGVDRIKEDICYQVFFDPNTERLREVTQEEEISAKFYLGIATNLRKLDRKTELVPYKSMRVESEDPSAETRKP